MRFLKKLFRMLKPGPRVVSNKEMFDSAKELAKKYNIPDHDIPDAFKPKKKETNE